MENEVLAGMHDTEQIKARMTGRMRQVSAWVRQAMSQKPEGHGYSDARVPPIAAREKPGGFER
jgi:hypothetical protein